MIRQKAGRVHRRFKGLLPSSEVRGKLPVGRLPESDVIEMWWRYFVGDVTRIVHVMRVGTWLLWAEA